MSVDAGPVVSNTTPLINLVGVDQLHLLRQIFGSVSIPQTVFDEFNAGRRTDDPKLEELEWLHVVPTPTLDARTAALDGGETAAISLAIEVAATTVAIDEARARRVAARCGLNVIGTLGLLIVAKRRGYLTEVRSVLNEMLTQGRRISDELFQEVLRQAAE